MKNFMGPILKDVTLVCLDTRNIEAAINSMALSLIETKFAESILFTTRELCSNHAFSQTKKLGIKIEIISKINSISDYSYFILTKLEKYIDTKFCLVTQWDGWIVNGQKWSSDFLEYDYIGAVWPHYTSNKIGNGGFSLRSKKLLRGTREIVLKDSDIPNILIEDDYICRRKRSVLEDNYNIKFPNINLANDFSIEGENFQSKPFGFHGMSNFNFALTKDNELKRIINELLEVNFLNRESYDLTKRLLKQNRLEVAKIIIKRRLIANGYSRKHIKLIFFLFMRKFHWFS